MAITALEYSVLVRLRASGRLPTKPDLLDLGMQNWYGDVSFRAVAVLAHEVYAALPEKLATFEADYTRIVGAIERGDVGNGMRAFNRLFYEVVFGLASYTAIDLDDAPGVLRHDLNLPVPLDKPFDVVTNIGTAEHVFDIGQVFRTVHRLTAPGGLMIHTAPVFGWWDHGFYTIQPTAFFDMAATNGYDIVSMTVGTLKPFRAIEIASREDFLRCAERGDIGPHGLVNCVLKKSCAEMEFRVPIQGVYAGTLSEEAMAAWRKLR